MTTHNGINSPIHVPSYSTSPYIVGSDNLSQYTTIVSAITAANNNGASFSNQANIYIKPGTYNESFTVDDGINLIGLCPAVSFANPTSNLNQAVIINGNIQSLSGSTVTFSNIYFSNNASYIFNPGDSGSVNTFYGCSFNATSSAFIFDFTGAGDKTINVYSSNLNTDGSSALFETDSNASAINIYLNFYDSIIFCQTGSTTSATSTGTNFNLTTTNSSFSSNLNFYCSSVNITHNYSSVVCFSGSEGMIINAAASGAIALNYCILYPSSSDNFIDTSNASGAYSVTILDCVNPNSSLVLNSSSSQPNSPLNYIDHANSSSAAKVLGLYRTGYALANLKTQQGWANTVNASPVVILSIPIPSNYAIVLRGIIVGEFNTFADTVGGTFDCVAKNNGGTCALVGTVDTSIKATTGALTCSFTCVISGTSLNVQITGNTGNIAWACTVDYQLVSTPN